MKDLTEYKFLNMADHHRIHILLVSILLLVFTPPFFKEIPGFTQHWVKLIFIIIITACYLIIRKNRLSRTIGYITLILVIAGEILQRESINLLGQIGMSYLIVHAFILVLREAMSLKGETKNMILVSITGYLIIGLLGGFMTAALAYVHPGSFTHSSGMELELYNYIYFSFVTMTTLGYGDIIPVTEKSEALSLMLVISGQLFLSVIIAINIAKFMQKKVK